MSTDVSFVELLKCMDNGPPWRPLVIDITCDMTWYLSDAPREMYWHVDKARLKAVVMYDQFSLS